MKKRLTGLLLLAALGGCVDNQPGSFMANVGPGGAPVCQSGGCMHGQGYIPRPIPGVMGPLGEPLAAPPAAATNPMAMAMTGAPTNDADAAALAARQTFAQSLPPQVAAQVLVRDDANKGIGLLQSGVPAGGILRAGGAPPPSEFLQAGGPMPPGGVMQAGGPGDFGGGPTTVPGGVPPVANRAYGVVAAVGALKDGPGPFTAQRTSVRFAGPNGMKVSWYVPGADGKPELAPTSLEVPGRYNFLQAAIYRLKLGNIPGRPGLELYPTLEVVPSGSKTATFLAHTSVPLIFTQEDFDQVAAGNYLVKVVYLPNPQFQDLAVTGPNEIVSSRLEPGADPIAEALQRGNILLIVRMGNIDLEAPNTPALDAPSPYSRNACPPGAPGAAGSPFVPLPGMPGPGMGMLPPPGMGGAGMMPPPGMMAGPGMMPPQGMGGPGMMPPPGMGGAGMMPPMGGMPPMGMMPPSGMMVPGVGAQPGMLPPGGPMIPAIIPPPSMPPPGAGAPPPAAVGPNGMKSVKAAMQRADDEETEEAPPPKPKRNPSPWSSSWFGGKSK